MLHLDRSNFTSGDLLTCTDPISLNVVAHGATIPNRGFQKNQKLKFQIPNSLIPFYISIEGTMQNFSSFEGVLMIPPCTLFFLNRAEKAKKFVVADMGSWVSNNIYFFQLDD